MEQITCALCGDNNIKIVSKQGIFEKNGPLIKFINVICLKCGLVYINPRPTSAELDEMYKKIYLSNRHNLKSISEAREFLSKIGTDKAAQIADFIREYLTPGKKVFDVGAGLGMVLSYLRDSAGAEVFGLEPSVESTEAAKNFYGVSMYQGTLDEYIQEFRGSVKFDCIILHHVFEHFGDPVQKLTQLKSLLNQNGLLYIEVPNLTEFNKPIYQFFDYCHLYNYTPATINKILEKENFKIIKWNQNKKTRIQIVATPKDSSWPELPRKLFVSAHESRRILKYLRRKRLEYYVYKISLPIRIIKQKILRPWHH